VKSPGTRAEADLDEAEAHLEAGRSAAAVALFEKHAEGELGGRALMGQARCAVQGGNFHRALLHLQTLEDLEPNNTAVHNVMGAALVGIGLLERAREELDKAVSADPKDIDSWRALAQLLDDLDDVPARVQACERLLALAPGDGDATRWLAAARADAAGAHVDLLDGPREAPPPATVSSGDANATPSEAARDLDSADIELEAGRMAEAARLYGQHLESEQAPRALLGIARAERGQGHAHQALSHLQRLEQRQPDHPELAGVMASVSYDLGCFDDAGEHFEHAIAQAPNDQKLWREYASFLQSTGDFKRIVEACQKVLQSSPERTSVAPPSSLTTVTGRSPGIASQRGSGVASQRDGGQVVAPGLAGALAGGVAHTMNGVLTTIMGIASVLEQEMAPNDPKVSDVGDIITACQHGRTLTRRLLDFSRHSNMRREPVALNEIVEGVATLLARTTPPRITTSLKLDDGRPTTHGDPAALAHALQQICSNAIEAMADGGTLTITTSWERVGKDESGDHPTELSPARYACIRVSDTGCGMAQETLRRRSSAVLTPSSPPNPTARRPVWGFRWSVERSPTTTASSPSTAPKN